MQNTIEKLTRLNIEIEGLLHVLKSRTNDNIQTLLGEKYREYTQAFEKLLALAATQTPVENVEQQAERLQEDIAETLQLDEVKDQEAVSSEIEPEDVLAEAAIEREEQGILHQDSDVNQSNSEVSVAADNAGVTTIKVNMAMATDESLQDEPVAEETEAVEPITEAVDDAETVVEEPVTEEADATSHATPSVQEFASQFKEEIPAKHDELRVDELLSRREARDLKRAFTLNDKFRFRRGLFAGNDSLFADTLNTLMSMKSFDEATDYLYNDLGWNPEDDDVVDFVAIVKNHFAGL